VLVAIGMRFDDRVTGDLKRYAKQAKIIHLELDPSEINKNVKADVAILGNVKETLPLLTDLVESKSYDSWTKEFKDCDKIEYEKVISKDFYPSKPGISMGEVIHIITEKTGGESIIVTDVGQHQMFASRYAKMKYTRSFVTSGGLGTMGFGLPAAHGAKIGAPDRTVVGIIGDGGFQMTIQELATINQTGAAVKIVLMNNTYLGMVRQWQQLFFNRRYSETHLKNPDFIKVAEGFGIKGRRILERKELEKAVEEMLNHDGPFLLEVPIEKEENVFPMVPSGASVSDIIINID
jgi:acetolactate synthase-1/2/3 large subunit